MERTFSVDDLIGNVYRLSGALGGMGNRTDSEAAFQEFLKRIPSATNLSAVGSAGGAASYEQTAQQLLSGGAVAASLPTAPLNTSLGSDPAPGMPRVPSLDLLRQLVLQNSLGNSLGQQAPAAPAGLKAEGLSAGEATLARLLPPHAPPAGPAAPGQRHSTHLTHWHWRCCCCCASCSCPGPRSTPSTTVYGSTRPGHQQLLSPGPLSCCSSSCQPVAAGQPGPRLSSSPAVAAGDSSGRRAAGCAHRRQHAHW